MLSRRMAWMVVLVATFTMTVSFIDRQAFAVLAPSVTKALDISDEAYGWLAAAFSIAYLVATPFSGWWIGRAGARRGLIASVLAWSTVAALHAIAPGFGVLFVLRLALGITEGPGFPGAAQTVQRILPPGDRERGFGVLFTGASIGAMLVPPFATLIYRHAGWRAAFLITAVAGLIWIPLWIAVTRSSDVRGRLDAVAPTTAEPRAAIGELLSHPIMIRALCALFTATPIFGFVQLWGSKYLVRTFALEQGDVGGYLFLPPLMFDAGALLFGDLASRQRRAEGAPARALFAVGVALSATLAVLPLAQTPWQAMFIVGVSNAGVGALCTINASDLFARMPAGSVSLAGGIFACAQSMALIISNPLIGRTVDRLGNYDAIAIAIGLWVIPGSVVWLLWRPAVRLVVRPRPAHVVGA